MYCYIGSGLRFVVATKDYAGLGFAVRLKDEGHEVILGTNPSEEDKADPERMKTFDLVGTGMVDKAPLTDFMSRREEMSDWYWVWDFNHACRGKRDIAPRGGIQGPLWRPHAHTMEHDRHACLEFAATYGLEAPASFPFTDIEEADPILRSQPPIPHMSISLTREPTSRPSCPSPRTRWMRISSSACICNPWRARIVHPAGAQGGRRNQCRGLDAGR